jgi:hypothetical protein
LLESYNKVRREKMKKYFIIMMMALMLIGCGGGGSDVPEDQTPAPIVEPNPDPTGIPFVWGVSKWGEGDWKN